MKLLSALTALALVGLLTQYGVHRFRETHYLRCKSQILSLLQPIEAHIARYGHPPRTLTIINTRCLYSYRTAGVKFSLSCRHGHPAIQVPAGYPRYDSRIGLQN